MKVGDIVQNKKGDKGIVHFVHKNRIRDIVVIFKSGSVAIYERRNLTVILPPSRPADADTHNINA